MWRVFEGGFLAAGPVRAVSFGRALCVWVVFGKRRRDVWKRFPQPGPPESARIAT